MLNTFYQRVFFLLFSAVAFSQNVSLSVISSQGDFSESKSISLEWTLGESFIETVHSENTIITQGFHQSFIDRILITNDFINDFEISIYPNPASESLFVQFENPDEKQFVIRLFDIHGRMLKKISEFDPFLPLQIDVSNLSSGIYLLKIYDTDSPLIDSQKILKL